MRWEKCLGHETPHLAAIGAWIYLANSTKPDIAFSISLLARFSAKPTKQHWNGVKHILRYLKGTKDLGLYYKAGEDSNIKGYMDDGCLSNPYKGKSQICYVFLRQGANNVLEINEAEPYTNILRPFRNHSLARGFLWMRLVETGGWLHQRFLWFSQCPWISNIDLWR